MNSNTVDIFADGQQENNIPPQEEIIPAELRKDTAPSAKAVPPVEQFTFSFSKKDGEFFYRTPVIKILIRTAFLSLLLILESLSHINLTIDGITEAYSAAPVFLPILAVYLIIEAVFFRRAVKRMRSAGEIFDDAVFHYNIYNSHIEVIRSKDGESAHTDYINFYDVKKIEKKENYIRIITENKFILLKENEMSPFSPFLHHINNSPLTKNLKSHSKFSLASTALFILTLLSVFFAIGVFFLTLKRTNSPDMDNMWVFFLFTPIPLASVCFGIFAIKKGYKFIKNIVAGIIVFVILCGYGSFSFIFKNVMTDSPELYLEAEELTGIDLPDYTSIQTHDWTAGSQNISRGYIFETSTAEITNAVSEAFRLKILKDDRWLKKIPTILIGITSDYCTHPYYEYALIYNVDTGEYNTLPEESGTYRFINIVFSAERDSLMVVDYEIEYTK